MVEVYRKYLSLHHMPTIKRTRTVQYAGQKLWRKLFRGKVDGSIDTKMVSKFGFNRRNKSTIHKDEFIWKQHKDSYGEEYTLAVLCSNDIGYSYFLHSLSDVVMIELEDESNINIY